MENKIKKNIFVDVLKIKEKFPKYSIPSKKKLDILKIGDVVKLSNGFEKFFVKITKFKLNDKKKIVGTILNKLLYNYIYDYGDSVEFNLNNIFEIIN